MKVPSKVRKVEIDDRFKKGLTSREFNTVAKVDKYGNKVDKLDNTMLKFYNLEKTKKVVKEVVEEKSDNEDEVEKSS
jgi:hypothetical protein